MAALSRPCAAWGIDSMDRFRLKWRIFSFLLGFCALLLFVLWIFQTLLLTPMYKAIRIGEIQKAISLVRENIDNSAVLSAILEELDTDKEIIVMLTQEFAPPSTPIERSTFWGGRRVETITQTEEFTLSDGRVISLTFYATISPVDATVSTLQIQLYFVTAIMVILAVFLAILISKKIAKPIEEINTGAKALASGDYNAHFSGHGFLEIKELSDTLNGAAEELSKTESLRRELMANISHDLRTPLALIYSYAEMMHDFPKEISSEQTQTIMDETKRLSSLVNDVLNVSQLEAGMMELNRSVYNLTESIGDTAERIAELVKKDGYNLLFEHEDDVYTEADEVKITQVVYNLLINAIHYSGEEKKIIIRQTETDGFVTIEVSDSGEGIAPEDLPHIWERYYKVDKTHKRAITGTGLGLSIVKKIMDLHGGECGAVSRRGEGSVFWFKLQKQGG